MFWFHDTKVCNKPGKNGSKILQKLKAFYLNEWTSFSRQDFPENRHLCDSDRVRIVMLDRHLVEDFICTDAHYLRLIESAGLGSARCPEPTWNRERGDTLDQRNKHGALDNLRLGP